MTALGEHRSPSVGATAPAGGPVPPGWHVDPAGQHEYRYWDGRRWTPGVADHGRVTEDALPDGGSGGPTFDTVGGSGPLLTFPARAAALGIAGLVGGEILGIGLGLVLSRLLDAPRVLVLLVAQGLLWAGMIGACVVVSRRYGSNSVRTDFGFRVRPVDLGWGVLLAIAGRLGAGVVVVVLAAVSRDLVGSNLTGIDELRNDVPTLVTYCLFAIVGAPLLEELFFRGLLLRALASRMPVALAVVVQGLLFCLAHVTPTIGLGNVSVLAGTAVFGVMAGATAVWLRRLGANVVGHSLFNVVAVLGLLLLT